MTPDDRDRLTRNESDLSHLQHDVAKMAVQMDRILNDMRHITMILDQAKGGWKIMIFAGTAAAAVGGAFAKYLLPH